MGSLVPHSAYNCEDFLEHYHRRSNVETVSAMVKPKFGDAVFKTTEAKTNEVLRKLVAHNLCVLIQAFYKLRIEAAFDATSAPGRRLALNG